MTFSILSLFHHLRQRSGNHPSLTGYTGAFSFLFDTFSEIYSHIIFTITSGILKFILTFFYLFKLIVYLTFIFLSLNPFLINRHIIHIIHMTSVATKTELRFIIHQRLLHDVHYKWVNQYLVCFLHEILDIIVFFLVSIKIATFLQ